MRRLGWAFLIVILLVVLGGILWLYNRSSANAPGISYPEVGRDHIGLNAALGQPYNSNPPSSGAHYASPANWRVYDYEVNDKIFIHNLEHGGVWIAYRPTISSEAKAELKAIVEEFSGSKLVMAPRSTNDADVAAVAWTKVLKFDLAQGKLSPEQKGQVRDFYKAYKNRGPEFVPDTMPGVDPRSVQQK